MKKQRLIILTLIAVLLFSQGAMAAQSTIFKDIGNHWSKEYVEDIYRRKITSGYGDNTYRPDQNVTGLEIMTMLSRLLQYDSKTENYTSKYQTLLNQYNIPDWAQEYVAFMLSEDILKTDELNQFVSNGKAIDIKRYEMVIFLGRVLEAYGGKETSVAYTLSYLDQEFIPQNAKVYVYMLIQEGMLDPSSNNGKFLPLNNLSRGEMAKLLSMTAQILDDYEEELEKQQQEPVTPPVTEPEPKPEETPTPIVQDEEEKDEITIVKGTFNSLIEGSNRTIINLTDEKNEIQNLDVAETVKITIDGKNGLLREIVAGQHLEIKLVNDRMEEIKVTSSQEAFKGTFVRVLSGANQVMTLKDMKGNNKVVTLPNTSLRIVYNNKEVATFNSFQEGDLVSLFEKDGKLVEIQGKSKTEYVKGVITDKGTNKNQYFEITTSDERVLAFPMEKDTVYRREGRNSNFASISLYDEVTLELEYGKAKTVTASVVKYKAKGYLRGITIGEDIVLTVETATGIFEEFVVDSSTTIDISDKEATVYDLRLGYYVEIQVVGRTVSSIYTTKQVEVESITGTIVYISNRDDYIEVEYVKDGEIYSQELTINSKTTYSNRSGSIKLSKIKEGDVVLVTGKTEKGEFIVEHIFVIESR